MSTSSQRSLNTTSLILLALAFIAAVIISNQVFKGWRIDLTDNNLYTLSDGTKRILEKIEEPINLHFYFSDKATENIPSLRSYANRVRELLEEFEAEADGRLNLSVTDPLPFSEEEDRAAQFRLQGVQLPASADTVYVGLAGTNSVGDEEIIPFFQPDKEEFLEYDIARLVSSLSQPELQSVGLISGVRMSGDFNPQTRQMQSPWVIMQQAQQLFEIEDLGSDVEEISADIGLLWIVQPKNLPDSTLYAIDQFIVAGGKALIFVDPLAEADPAASPQGMPDGMPPQGQGSDLPALFDAWGLKYATGEVVADAGLALQVSSGMTGRPVRHLGLLGITAEQLNAGEAITADLESINVGMAGHLSLADDSSLGFEPLVTSSQNAAIIPTTRFNFLPDPAALQREFSPTGEKYVIAARLNGIFPSAFPDGPPEAADDAQNPQDPQVDDTDDEASADEEAPADENDAGEQSATAGDPAAAGPDDSTPHSGESTGNVIVVADVDILSDRMWVQIQDFFGQQIANAFADNGTFAVNALDNLSGSSDLIDVRSRASYSRPFTRVEALRVQAEARFQETEQSLQRELEDTERRLSELQSSREDTGDILMTEEQQAEIDRFIDRRAEIRQELRAVQRGLDRDIERLGTVLKSINIALVPLLLTVFVLVAVWRRSRRGAS
ncbi:MAG: Gldg family protein [Woeseia sp.]